MLRWSDLPHRHEDGDAVRAIREYKLTYQCQHRAEMEADDQTAAPGPFVKVAVVSREEADLSDVDRRNLRDAIWRLLDEAGAALDAIG